MLNQVLLQFYEDYRVFLPALIASLLVAKLILNGSAKIFNHLTKISFYAALSASAILFLKPELISANANLWHSIGIVVIIGCVLGLLVSSWRAIKQVSITFVWLVLIIIISANIFFDKNPQNFSAGDLDYIYQNLPSVISTRFETSKVNVKQQSTDMFDSL